MTGTPAARAADDGATIRLRIGEVAEQAGVSTRTVRYYEQLGLLGDVNRTAGGTRWYTTRDVEVLNRIRDLQAVMGFDLDQIRVILEADRRTDELREQWFGGPTLEHQRAILVEAKAINTRLRSEVAAKRAQLDDFLAELDAKAVRLAEAAAERGIDLEDTPAAET